MGEKSKDRLRARCAFGRKHTSRMGQRLELVQAKRAGLSKMLRVQKPRESGPMICRGKVRSQNSESVVCNHMIAKTSMIMSQQDLVGLWLGLLRPTTP